MSSSEFDAVVVGSGITGGLAAKYLSEAGFKTLIVERGRNIDPAKDYVTEFDEPWDRPKRPKAASFLVRRDEEPYEVEPGKPFEWTRGYQLGGKSLVWGRHVPRFSADDFEQNARDGYGCDWPIRYSDLAPWYDKVESYIGVSAQAEGHDQMPDGKFLPPFPLNAAEMHLRRVLKEKFNRTLTPGRNANLTVEHRGRGPCQSRNHCGRGCSFKGYYSSNSGAIPDAVATGRLTVLTGKIAEKLMLDKSGRRAIALVLADAVDGSRSRVTARMFVICAGAFNSVHLLMNSVSEAYPRGIGGDHDVLGRYIMDHVYGSDITGILPGYEDRYAHGNKPPSITIPPFANVGDDRRDFVRTYFYQGETRRLRWGHGAAIPGIGRSLREAVVRPGPWFFNMGAYGDTLPRPDNRLTLSRNVDRRGIPRLHIDFTFGDNDRKMIADASREAVSMFNAAGIKIIDFKPDVFPAGSSIHEMGGARMGRDPTTSVLNRWNQVHQVPNILVTDGAAMASSSCKNPSLTYMAITARAVDHAAQLLRARST